MEFRVWKIRKQMINDIFKVKNSINEGGIIKYG